MLYIFVSVLIIFPVLMSFGRLSQKIFGAFWEGLSAQLVLGILFLMTVWSVLSFFVPLNIDLERITVSCGFFLFFYFQSYKEFLKIDRKNWLLWGGFSLVSLVMGKTACASRWLARTLPSASRRCAASCRRCCPRRRPSRPRLRPRLRGRHPAGRPARRKKRWFVHEP